MLKVYNTLGRKLEEFKLLDPTEIKIYHCGPTVYWTQHIGNMRAMVMMDLIRRSFLYLGYNLKFVRNYTDFGHLVSDADEGEDKMEKAARREQLDPQKIADKYIAQFEHDTDRLNIMRPDKETRATDYLAEMIAMVKELLDKGFAYNTPKAIYFDVSKFPNYTALSGHDLSKDLEGAGVGSISDPDKRNPADFALWFFRTGPHKNALQYWPSPFSSPEVENGDGFPGWHIECSAMIRATLGKTIDIHMGGVEHISIHHTNEIAQSESANGVKFVNYWLHNEHLMLDSKKISKSDGNFFTLDQVIEKGYDPMYLRYFFLQAHYRSKQNFTWEALTASKVAYEKLVAAVAGLQAETGEGEVDAAAKAQFVKALSDDFSIPQALAATWNLLKSDLQPAVKLATILDFDKVLGLKLSAADSKTKQQVSDLPEAAKQIITERELARSNQDYAKADQLRKTLKDKYNYLVQDNP